MSQSGRTNVCENMLHTSLAINHKQYENMFADPSVRSFGGHVGATFGAFLIGGQGRASKAEESKVKERGRDLEAELAIKEGGF